MVENKILEIFNELFQLNFESVMIDRNAVPEWDSMKHAQLVLMIQKKLTIVFQTKDIIAVKNLNELVIAADRLLKL